MGRRTPPGMTSQEVLSGRRAFYSRLTPPRQDEVRTNNSRFLEERGMRMSVVILQSTSNALILLSYSTKVVKCNFLLS